MRKTLFILILIALLLGTVAAAFGFTEPVYVFLKPNQDAIVVPTYICDRFIVENLPDKTLKVTCRVWLNSGSR